MAVRAGNEVERHMDPRKTIQAPAHSKHPIGTANGFLALFVGLAHARRRRAHACAIADRRTEVGHVRRWRSWSSSSAILVLAGLYTLQPNEAAILQLFGAYRGTSRVPGLRATNPFYTRKKLSLRARNLNGDRLKVNDKRGNPIEIAAVVVWHVDDTAKAAFDVDDYENFVKVQSEAAVRHLASSFAYDAEIAPTTRASPRCSKARTSSPPRSSRSCRRASSRRASWSRKRASRTSRTRRRSRR